jgi:hypothetical protein
MLLQTELQSLKFRKTLADICEKIAKALANDGVRQDRMRSRGRALNALQFGSEQRQSCCQSLYLMWCVPPSQNQISRDSGEDASRFDERDDACDAANELHIWYCRACIDARRILEDGSDE